MRRVSIVSYKVLKPCILVAQTDLSFGNELIRTTRLVERMRQFKVVHDNANKNWHKNAGKTYHVTTIPKGNELFYDGSIAKLISEALLIYNKVFHNLNINHDTGYNILHYLTGGDYPWHYDGSNNSCHAFILIQLNDDYEGGDLEFYQFKHVIKPKAGQLIIAPTGPAFEHRSTKITKGEKFLIRARLFNDKEKKL